MINKYEVKITFGIIVLNGEPFSRYCIHALYPHAHEIIISEGACEGARNVATSDGHSLDGTLEILREIKKNDDPDNKIIIVTAEDEGHPDGFWPGEKHEQSRAFTKRATGNYLWQVDIDEFYLETDICKIKSLFEKDNSITCLSFKQFSFWGGFSFLVDSWYFKRHLPEIFRVFKWDEGYQYVTHRPPTIVNKEGVNLKDINFLNASKTEESGIYMYHYSYVFPKQVLGKASYYSNSNWLSLDANNWFSSNYTDIRKLFRIFIIPEYPSWLSKFKGTHPKIIEQLINDIKEKKIIIEERKTEDIEKLVDSYLYYFAILILKFYEPIDCNYLILKKKLKSKIKQVIYALKFL